ncbi:MAG: hypothetical protein Q7S92_00665 [Candidatus Diapherotrites archaeon]|nr:hypothetical protein [Candidatus Diapherotrites archaeon]
MLRTPKLLKRILSRGKTELKLRKFKQERYAVYIKFGYTPFQARAIAADDVKRKRRFMK